MKHTRYIDEVCSESSSSHPERRAIAEYFCSIPLLIKLEKLIQIFLVSKSSKPHQEIRAKAEHFCCGNTLLFLRKLEKLIQISVLISV